MLFEADPRALTALAQPLRVNPRPHHPCVAVLHPREIVVESIAPIELCWEMVDPQPRSPLLSPASRAICSGGLVQRGVLGVSP